MRAGAGAASRHGPGARRLRDGGRLRPPGNAAAIRNRTWQRPVEPRRLRRRSRLGSANSTARNRDIAARRRERTAKGHGGSRDDPGRPGDPQCDLRRHRPSFPGTAGDRAHAEGSPGVTKLALTVNGRAIGPIEVRDELTMNDFLREFLGMTGTKFGCGAAQCLSCAVIVDDPDGTSRTYPTCVRPAVGFNGKSIRTVEGHAKDGKLTPLQQAFVE